MTKKLIALFLAIVTCAGVFAGCTGGTGGNGGNGGNGGTGAGLNGKTVNICVVYQEGLDHNNCYLTKTVEQKLGCNLEYLELDDFGTTYVTQLSDGVAPDLTWYSGYNAAYEQYGIDGAYINIYDHLDKMPNVKAYIESQRDLIQLFETEDGKLYVLPQSDVGGSAENYAYLYREDIFQKHNLTWPTNQAEFETVLRTLKEKYPDSTPFTMRNLNGSLQGAQTWGFLWGASHTGAGQRNTIFTLDANGNYYNAYTTDAYKEMGQYIQKLRAEGLMDRSCMTHTTQTWTEALASDHAFITYDKVDRLPQLNYAGKSANAEFQLIAGAPFNMGTYATKTSEVITSWGGKDSSGNLFIGDNDNLNATLAYVDWLFSEDGFVTCNWGIKGESYDVDENGKKYYLPAFMAKEGTLMGAGLNYNTTGGQWDYDSFLATCDEKLVKSLAVAAEFAGKGTIQYNLKYNKSERRIWDTYYKPCGEYARAEWMKFVIGQRDWSTWDSLKTELQGRYQEGKLLQIANSALERISYREK